MNQLDIDKINSLSAYKVEEANEENFFKFFTEHDVHYSVGFMPDDSLMQSEAYHLIIVNVDNRPSPSDRKVKDTVLAIVEEFFDKNNTRCSTSATRETGSSDCAAVCSSGGSLPTARKHSTRRSLHR